MAALPARRFAAAVATGRRGPRASRWRHHGGIAKGPQGVGEPTRKSEDLVVRNEAHDGSRFTSWFMMANDLFYDDSLWLIADGNDG